ncbi:hypothetical protein B0T17DRAFT_77990 [Bombardia bombarda]|uniref:Uncharacterized protein n=1 Tax=Bombardia bombarda TaxID=252184 RepID=A0AA39XLP2_9PEZI|nr:hypothetical protein B0T17DRAFT_77990 [Bombardia bombarda]
MSTKWCHVLVTGFWKYLEKRGGWEEVLRPVATGDRSDSQPTYQSCCFFRPRPV